MNQKFNVKKGWRGSFNTKGKEQVKMALDLLQNNKFEVLRRPFLLQQIQEFFPDEIPKKNVPNRANVKSKTKIFNSSLDIYETLIHKWIQREAVIVVERIEKVTMDIQIHEKEYARKIYDFSTKLARFFFQLDRNDLGLAFQQDQEWLSQLWGKKEELGLAHTHSLLTREADDKFRFAHPSLFDFFLAEAVFNDRLDETDFREKEDKYAEAFEFYNQICWQRLTDAQKQMSLKLDSKTDCHVFLAEKYKHNDFTRLLDRHILRFEWMPVRAILIGQIITLEKIEERLLPNDSLFTVLNLLVYEKMKGQDKAFQHLFAAAKTLLKQYPEPLTKNDMGDSHWENPLKWVLYDRFKQDPLKTGTFQFIHPIFFHFFLTANFTGFAQRNSLLPLDVRTTRLPERRDFVPPLSNYFLFEYSWYENAPFFNKLKMQDEQGNLIDLTKIALAELQALKFLALQKNDLTAADVQRLLPYVQNLDTLDLRHNLLSDFLIENTLPQNERFKMFLENNPFTKEQKAEWLNRYRYYLKETTVMDFNPALNDSGLYPEMMPIAGGKFTMGDDLEADTPTHEVEVSPFEMGKYQVTVRQFHLFVNDLAYHGDKPFQTEADILKTSFIFSGKGDNGWTEEPDINWLCDAEGKPRPETDWEHPVIHVSWYDSVAYCNWLSEKNGLQPVYKPNLEKREHIEIDYAANGYRLPTEAEWEFVGRNGAKQTKYSWGNLPPIGKNGGNVGDESFRKMIEDLNKKLETNWGVGDFFKQYETGFSFTSPVGSFKPNTFGIFDLTGNVNEWCNDWYDADYYKKSPVQNPQGATSGDYRVLRGGSWLNVGQNSRSAFRNNNTPGNRNSDAGFRVICLPQSVDSSS